MLRWVRVVVLAFAVVQVGCGDTDSHPGGAAGSGGAVLGAGGNSSGSGQGGAQGGGAGVSATAGNNASGGAAVGACMSRTTNHLHGTRLKYHEVRTAEGDVAYDGFYDSMTGEDCAADIASDGKLRCLPTSRSAAQFLFADATCSEALYSQEAGCAAHKYVSYTDFSDPCKSLTRLYLAGEAYTGPLFQNGGGTCLPAPATNLPVVRQGAPVDPSQFVEIEAAQLPESGRIARDGYKSADGAFMVRGYYDKMFDVGCGFGRMRDGKEHCLPRYGAFHFSDAACTMPLVGIYPTSCNTKTDEYFARSVSDGCNSGPIAVKRDKPYVGAAYEPDRTTAECTALTPTAQTGLQLFTATDLPDSAVPEVTFTTVDSDPGRIKPMYRTSSDGSCSFYDFWDSELKIECYFSGDPANGYYCYPEAPSYDIRKGFSDAACSVPVDYVAVQTCFAGQAKTYMTTWSSGACNQDTASVRKLGAGVAGPAFTLFEGAPGACTPLVADPDSTYFTLGPELPAASLVRGERVPL